jgi:hypothetical protein
MSRWWSLGPYQTPSGSDKTTKAFRKVNNMTDFTSITIISHLNSVIAKTNLPVKIEKNLGDLEHAVYDIIITKNHDDLRPWNLLQTISLSVLRITELYGLDVAYDFIYMYSNMPNMRDPHYLRLANADSTCSRCVLVG